MLPLLLLPLVAAADPPATDTAKADEAIHQYLVAETTRLSGRFMDGAKTKAEWEAKRPRLKREFLDMMGLWPLPEKTDLKATVTGTIERSGVAIEKLHFQSRPGLYVTGNLYRPKETGKKYPAILYVCGHSGRGRDGNKTAFQDHGLWFASNGYVCLVVDTLQLGEIPGKHHGTYNLNRWWWQDRGYTPAGVECWNGIRAIDYLCSRADVDPDRIGVTGISGGGATTCWVAAADDRVKVAVPVSGISDLECYVSHKVIDGHCDCMFFYNTYQWEWTTVLALHAPKPLLFVNSDNDSLFPMDGNRRIIARLRHCYDMLGATGNVNDHVSPGGHAYRPDLRIAVFSFLNKYLKNDTSPVKDADFPKIDGKDLRVFPEDKDLPKDAINAKVDETFVPKAEVKLPEKKEEFATWKAGLKKQLREVVFRDFLPANPRREFIGLPDRTSQFETELGIRNQAYVWNEHEPGTRLLVCLNPEEDYSDAKENWTKRFPDVKPILTTYTRGGGITRWTVKNPPNYVERSMALFGRTVDAGRLWDVSAAAAYQMRAGRHTIAAGKGNAGVLLAYVGLSKLAEMAVEKGGQRLIDELVILDPPTSHRDGPHFLGVNRVLDIPEALGLLAPDVKLTLIGKNAKDKAFDKTAEMYKLAGAADKFKRE
ncbi:MAG TPA: prolyl oligopeptidase family serine peptidase [Fimbriiglobus sp.]|jgi:dienelactone hydrolase